MLWLAEQGLASYLAIASLIVLLVICITKVIIKTNTEGDEAMVNKKREIVNVMVECLFSMGTNIAGNALLAKAL